MSEESARLLDALAKEKPWCDKPWARMALAIGARAIRRGRLLTEREKTMNLAASMEQDGPEFADLAARIRKAAPP